MTKKCDVQSKGMNTVAISSAGKLTVPALLANGVHVAGGDEVCKGHSRQARALGKQRHTA